MGAVLLALLTLSAPNSPRANARVLFAEAEEFYRLGEFDEALQRYELSYELSQKPALLFNIGQCYRELGQYEKAAFFYEQYLARERKSRHRKNVKSMIEYVEQQAAEQEEREKKEREAELSRLEQERLEKAAALERAESERLAAEAAAEAARAERLRIESQIESQAGLTAEVDDDEEGSITGEWWFWASIGVVAAAAAGSTYFLLRGDDPVADYTLDRR